MKPTCEAEKWKNQTQTDPSLKKENFLSPDASLTLTGSGRIIVKVPGENRKYRNREINRSRELSWINIC